MIFIFYFILFFSALTFCVALYNLFTAPEFTKLKNDDLNFSIDVSVLIPARNEENNISNILNSVLAQSHKRTEIIVLDDNSTDNTFKIASDFSKQYSNLKIIEGEPLPENWIGKNWACYQLYQNSKSEILIFVDADVWLDSQTLNSAIYYFEKYRLNLLTCFPTQKINSFGEKLIVPLMDWLLINFLPLRKVYSSRISSFVAANGQFLMIDKKTYEQIGTHKNFAGKIVEDMEIARAVKSSGNKMMTFLGNNLITCKMYSIFAEAFNGFSKNFFAGFNLSPFVFITFLIFIEVIFLLPFLFLIFDSVFFIPVILILLSRILNSILSKQNILMNIFLHPVQMLFLFFIGINSIKVNLKNEIVWKQRKY